MKNALAAILLLIPLPGFCATDCLKKVKKTADRLTLDSCVGLKVNAIRACRKQMNEDGPGTDDEDFLENCLVIKNEALAKCRKKMYAKLAASSCGAKAPKAPETTIEKYADTREDELDVKRRVGEAFGNLSGIRAAIAKYFNDHDGLYPPALEALVPAYLKPEALDIHLPGRAPGSKPVNVKSFSGSDTCAAVKNTGGWLYIADKNSPKYGDVVIDTREKLKGTPGCEW